MVWEKVVEISREDWETGSVEFTAPASIYSLLEIEFDGVVKSTTGSEVFLLLLPEGGLAEGATRRGFTTGGGFEDTVVAIILGQGPPGVETPQLSHTLFSVWGLAGSFIFQQEIPEIWASRTLFTLAFSNYTRLTVYPGNNGSAWKGRITVRGWRR